MGKTRGKEFALDFLADVAGGFIQAVALHCFIDNIDIAPGGASGMAILLNRLTSLPIGTLTFLINIPLLIASWIYLGKEKTIKTLKTVAIMTVILDGLVTPYFPVYSGTRWCPAFFGECSWGSAWRSYLCAVPQRVAAISPRSFYRSSARTCRPERLSWLRIS